MLSSRQSTVYPKPKSFVADLCNEHEFTESLFSDHFFKRPYLKLSNEMCGWLFDYPCTEPGGLQS